MRHLRWNVPGQSAVRACAALLARRVSPAVHNGGFVRRLNRLADGFPALLERWGPAGAPASWIRKAESFLGSAGLANPAVYCQGCPGPGGERLLFDQEALLPGVKIRVIGDERPGTLPRPRSIALTAANLNDCPVPNRLPRTWAIDICLPIRLTTTCRAGPRSRSRSSRPCERCRDSRLSMPPTACLPRPCRGSPAH